jgi:hypothetical protein
MRTRHPASMSFGRLSLLALLAAAPCAQSLRTMELTTPPRLGTTMIITLRHPAAAAGNYFETLFSLPTATVLNLGIPGIVGSVRVDLNAFQSFITGALGSGGSTVLSLPLPNLTNLIGGGFDVQLIDVSLSPLRIFLSDNDLEIRPFPGICKVHLMQASNRSPVTGNNDMQTVTDASIGAPVSQGLAGFAFQSIQPRGQEGFVAGYGGPFTGISHNSDVEVETERRVAKRCANAAYQVVALPNGYDVGLVRQATNQRHFTLWSYRRSAGVATFVPNSLVIDTGPLNTPASNWMPHAAFSSDGNWGVVIARDTNTAVRDRVFAFRTDGSAPAIDITATAPVSATYFDGSCFFTSQFVVIAGSGGWYWTSATAPATLAALPVPNTTASNGANRWVYPFSWRVSRDGARAYFPIGSHATDSRAEMDVVRLTNNAGTPQVVNVTQFAAATRIAEFGYSAVTPSPLLDSSFGMKAALSPDGTRLAFLGMGPNAGVYVATGTANPAPLMVAGATFYSEVTFLNATTVLFCAGPDPASQNMYALAPATNMVTPLTATGDLRTRGQFWSRNQRWWYFVRSNALGTVNNFVGVDANAATVTLKDITGGEFSAGTAPALRTGSLNATVDPWPGLEFQLRAVPLSDYAVFAARRVIAAPNLYEDANVFRFDMENGGQAVMLTNRTGTGTSSAVRNIESVTVAGDPLFVAWAERLGIVATSSEDVYVTSILGNAEVRRVSAANPAGQSVVDGSIRFTCLPAAGVVWAVGQGRIDVPEDNVAVQWSALGSAVPLTRLSPAPVLTRVFQVIGVSQ